MQKDALEIITTIWLLDYTKELLLLLGVVMAPWLCKITIICFKLIQRKREKREMKENKCTHMANFEN